MCASAVGQRAHDVARREPTGQVDALAPRSDVAEQRDQGSLASSGGDVVVVVAVVALAPTRSRPRAAGRPVPVLASGLRAVEVDTDVVCQPRAVVVGDQTSVTGIEVMKGASCAAAAAPGHGIVDLRFGQEPRQGADLRPGIARKPEARSCCTPQSRISSTQRPWSAAGLMTRLVFRGPAPQAIVSKHRSVTTSTRRSPPSRTAASTATRASPDLGFQLDGTHCIAAML